MMKQFWIKIMALSLVTVLVTVGCSTTSSEKEDMKETPVKTSIESNMEKDNSMDDEKDMEVKEDMSKEDMSKEDMSKEEIMDEEAVASESIEQMMNEGDQAPAFEFVDFDGNIVNNETLKGEKVYLKYWASWCSICLAGLSEVDELFVQENDFTAYTVVTPNANGEMSQDEFKTWFEGLEQKNIKVLFDMKGQAATEFGVRAFPTSIFIGSDGVLIQAVPGHKSNDAIVQTVETFK